MIGSQNAVRKSYGLLILAALLLVFAGACMYFGSHNYPIRVLGSAAILASVYLARISQVRGRSDLPDLSTRSKNLKTSKGPGRVLWIISLALVPLLAAAGFLLHIDVANGGNETWPVDVFAGIALACTIVWSYLAAKIFGGRMG